METALNAEFAEVAEFFQGILRELGVLRGLFALRVSGRLRGPYEGEPCAPLKRIISRKTSTSTPLALATASALEVARSATIVNCSIGRTIGRPPVIFSTRGRGRSESTGIAPVPTPVRVADWIR